MTTTTNVTITCNDCKEIIDANSAYVNAGSYGADFHLSCFETISAPRLMALLAIDDIKVMKFDKWDSAKKINSYYRHFA